MKRIISISLCIAALLSCRPAEQKNADILVGVYAATSGSEAAFGQATVQGEQLAAEEINRNGGVLGRKIRLVVEDDQGKAEEAVSVVTKVITHESVLAILCDTSCSYSF